MSQITILTHVSRYDLFTMTVLHLGTFFNVFIKAIFMAYTKSFKF